MAEIVDINEIKKDQTNANRHTKRGQEMIRDSIVEFGFAEAGTLDKNNRLIGGNLRTEIAKELEMGEAIIIDVDGSKPVFTRRKDLDLTENKARRLAYALNRVAQVSIDFSPEQVLADISTGIDLSKFFDKNEIDDLLSDFEKNSSLGQFPELKAEDEQQYIHCPSCGFKFVNT